jgi:hypothetical protein
MTSKCSCENIIEIQMTNIHLDQNHEKIEQKLLKLHKLLYCEECEINVPLQKVEFGAVVLINFVHLSKRLYQDFTTTIQMNANYYDLKNNYWKEKKTFTTYSKIFNHFWYLNDATQTETQITDFSIKISPCILIYVKRNFQINKNFKDSMNNLKSMSFSNSIRDSYYPKCQSNFEYSMFPNSIYAAFEDKIYQFVNLCTFNSVTQGFAFCFKTDSKFKKYVEDNSSKFHYFLNLIDFVKGKDNFQRNQKYIEYLKQYYPILKNEFLYFWIKKTDNRFIPPDVIYLPMNTIECGGTLTIFLRVHA